MSSMDLADPAGQQVPPADDDWLDSMRLAIRSTTELRRMLGLATTIAGGPDSTPAETSIDDENHGFPVFVPREFAARMRPGDETDPLLMQVMPTHAEGVEVAGFHADPVGDLQANVAPGVLHKYAARALVITTGACGVHCRYCFRRAFPYQESGSRSQAYEPSLAYLRERRDLEEVILSGGDPLTMTDAALDALISKIEGIEHIGRLRIHSRMPIVIPSRVNRSLIERLRASRLTVWMVVHSNHAAEIDGETAAALQRMVDAGIPVLNQSVLLRGVNDSVEDLESLSRALIDCRVIPYYLHQLDRVAGAAHFEVSPARGRELIEQLESRLPGFAVPRYVSEIAGEKSKTRL
ncbi:EF-P beta-lysylation protein EpmB [Allorhodopirellula heiligendammensis]|uniref:L-lysine 2,3-aminomutase n=1 Tax=Allorhodopirellula heiligendammensis TaxID=2714739 RepID=A0A5C6C2D9_9BACT|nr:EF-P beta-lysylation protein EpmB [Allorhodopirellula heiligendammensis]TWU18298.1 L-lysine 2,3-aminomutase [Allorhodopirellula heiligendammensis]